MRHRWIVLSLLATACAHPRSTLIIVGDASPLYVCCGEDGCVGVAEAASCGPGQILYSCEAGETTVVDGKPAVVCHDQE